MTGNKKRAATRKRRFSIFNCFGVGSEVLTAVSTKMAVFWVVAPCSLVDVYQRFRGPCCLITLMMEAVRTSETMVNFYQTTRRYNPEDSHLCCFGVFSSPLCLRENFK
jgi:hypothetical protein